MNPSEAMKTLPWSVWLAWYLVVPTGVATAGDAPPDCASQPARLYVALLGTSP